MKQKQINQNWKEFKFLDCLENEASQNSLKINKQSFLEEGKFPIIDQGDNYIAGYTDDKNKIYSKQLPVVVFGDHTRAIKFIDFPFALGADGIKVLVPRENIDAKYFYYALRKLNILSAGYSRHYKFLKEKKVSFPVLPNGTPDLEKQKQIVAILERAEGLKDRRGGLDELFDEYLKSVFYEMFLKGDFEVKGFLDVFDITTGKIDSNAMDEGGIYPFFTCSQETFKINKYAFDCEALLLAGNNAAGKYSVKYYKGKFNAYQRTYVLTLKDSGIFKYFHFVLTNKLEELRHVSIGTNTKYLTMGILKNIKIPLPPIEFQEEFAKIVKQVEKIKDKLKDEKRDADELFNVLMQRAFSGELV